MRKYLNCEISEATEEELSSIKEEPELYPDTEVVVEHKKDE